MIALFQDALEGASIPFDDYHAALSLLTTLEAKYASDVAMYDRAREDQLAHIDRLRKTLPQGMERQERLTREVALVHDAAYKSVVAQRNLGKIQCAIAMIEDLQLSSEGEA